MRTKKRQTTLLATAMLTLLNGGTWAVQKCDTSKPETTPVDRLKVNHKEGTVFDSRTRLTWKICAEGIAYSDGRCTGNAQFTWNEATKTFDDKVNGWRMPNIDELNSIVERRCAEPSINLQVFPNTQPAAFWSGSAFASDSDYAYNLYFGRGLIGNDLKAGHLYVRLVRGAQWFDPAGIAGKKK